MRNRHSVLAALLIGAVTIGGVFLAVEASRDSGLAATREPTRPTANRRPALASQAASLAAPAKPAFTVPSPQPLRPSRHGSMWAPVIRPVLARAHPQTHARIVARISTRTPERTTNILLALGTRQDRAHRLWVRVRLPILPNNTAGWVPRSTLGGYRFVRTHLVIDLHSLDATLYRGKKVVFRAPVGVGARATPTPTGRFYIRDRLARYASPFYGPIAFGTSARSPVLTDWPAGGYIGIHGTNHPQLIPGRISHGCVRLRNADIRRLAAQMPIGTPITIR